MYNLGRWTYLKEVLKKGCKMVLDDVILG